MISYQYIARRLMLATVSFLIATSLAFFILNAIPGDLAYVIMGDFATEEKLRELRIQLGLDRPIPLRYVEWLANMLQGELGQSVFSHEPVMSEMRRRLPVTLEVAVLAAGIAPFVGLPAGIITGLRPNSMADFIIRPASIIGIALPSFWTGLLVLMVPSVLWNYAPPRFVPFFENPIENLRLMLPAALIISLAFTASISRMSRTTMMEVMREDYVRTARSKGVTEFTVTMRHALRNALIPVMTMVSLQFAVMLGGTVIIENIFSLPGMGTSVIQSITSRDYPMIQGFVTFMVVVYVCANLFVDIMASFLDPRIRL